MDKVIHAGERGGARPSAFSAFMFSEQQRALLAAGHSLISRHCTLLAGGDRVESPTYNCVAKP